MRPAAAGEAGALAAATGYRVARAWPLPDGPVALVEAVPQSGRQHQIRVHLRACGTPLLVDPLYGLPGPAHGAERLTLHAAQLEFADPRDGSAVAVAAPLAPDLRALLERLDRLAAPETNGPPG
jgi:23S rRNA-/tRNA-specific pseudouridylate synthase